MITAPHIRMTGGAPLFAGLSWSPATQGALPAPGPAGVRLVWRSRIVDLRDQPNVAGAGSLLAQMALGNERAGHDRSGRRLYLARVAPQGAGQGDRWWLGATEDGVPSLSMPEKLYASPHDLAEALVSAADAFRLAGIAAPADDLDHLRMAFAGREGLPAPVVCDPAPLGQDSPVFATRPHLSRPVLAGAAGVATLALAGGIAFAAGVFTPSPEPDLVPVERAMVPAQGAFATACAGALSQPWPTAPGWREDATGCALARHLPDDLDPVTGIDDDALAVWRRLALQTGANQVLANRAADHMNAAWPYGHARAGEDSLLFWRAVPLEMVEANPDTAPPTEDLHRRLAEMWVSSPGAVSTERGRLTLRVSTPPAEALSRLAGVDGTDLLTARHSDSVTEIVLRPGGRKNREQQP